VEGGSVSKQDVVTWLAIVLPAVVIVWLAISMSFGLYQSLTIGIYNYYTKII
jgi:hypothetical protein